MSRAAERLNMAVQTVSAQVRLLERDLGCQLLRPAGRGLALTEAGTVALQQAEHIFQLSQALPEQVLATVQAPSLRLAVGIADGLPKLEVRRLLQPVLCVPNLRLMCDDGEMADLLADLVLHKLDVVLTDHPAPSNSQLKVHSHSLGSSDIGWYGSPHWWQEAHQGFPDSLQHVPVLLPTTHSMVRGLLDRWLLHNGLRPRVVGEIEDSALLETFGSTSLGVFPAALAAEEELLKRSQVKLIGACEGVQEHYYAISTERKVMHPLVQQILRSGTDAQIAPVPVPLPLPMNGLAIRLQAHR